MTEYFSHKELACPCCGRQEMKPKTRARFNALREDVGFPMYMTSGYRCPQYNTEKGYTQTHATGQAGDIACSHGKALIILSKALEHGFTGIGVQQKGVRRFIHLDDLDELFPTRPRPHIWSY